MNESTAAQEWSAVVRIADVSADRRQLTVSAAAIWHARDAMAEITRERDEAYERGLQEGRIDLTQIARDFDAGVAREQFAEMTKERDALRAEVERLRGALHEIAEEWAGAECGTPVHAQEAYAIALARRMYTLAALALQEPTP